MRTDVTNLPDDRDRYNFSDMEVLIPEWCILHDKVVFFLKTCFSKLLIVISLLEFTTIFPLKKFENSVCLAA